MFSFIAAVAVFSFATAQQASGKDVLKQVNDYRSALIKEARDAKKTVDFQELTDKTKAKIAQLTAGIDFTKVEASECLDWARVMQMAGDNKSVCDLAKRYLETGPNDTDRFQAMYLMASACNAQGEADMLAMTLNDIPVPTFNESNQIGMMTTNVFVDTIYDKKGLAPALATLDAVEKKLTFEDPKAYSQRMLPIRKRNQSAPNAKPKTDEELTAELEAACKNSNESTRFSFANKRADLYSTAGKRDAAIEVLETAIAKIDKASPNFRRANAALTMIRLTGATAPAIVSERSHGVYEGLESLKGKVVIVDFFAHWCGPCIAAFPEMEKMYAELKDKGLEIVGVTTYYGYYKGEGMPDRNLPKDVEFGKMKDFMTEHKIPWSVVYGERTNLDAYGVTGIPTAVLIGRDGKVRELHVGYSPESFKKFRQEVEKVLAER